MEQVLVPDYFEDFHCKCGACRHPCCDGWGINISEHEYFSLIGIECSRRLRNKLDDAFVVSRTPTEDSYASIQPNYLEQCPMLDEDGLCLLQKEKGEATLPLICRVYPRAVRDYGGTHEICMSCSCEATVELLRKSNAPLTLHAANIELPFRGTHTYDQDPEKDRLRHAVIAAMSDPGFPIVDRIGILCDIVTGEPRPAYDRSDAARSDALSSLLRLLGMISAKSKSMQICGVPVLARFEGLEDGDALRYFDAAEARLYAQYPDVEAFAGRVISNHLLYESFPYTEGCDSPDTAFAAFCTAVALLKLLCVGGMAEGGTSEDFTDILAYANRFIEHSDFYRVCSHLNHPRGAETYVKFAPLLEKAAKKAE